MFYAALKDKCEKFTVHTDEEYSDVLTIHREEKGTPEYREKIFERLYQNIHEETDIARFSHENFKNCRGYTVDIPVSDDNDPATMPIKIEILNKE